MKTTILLGPPGTGKTTSLLDLVSDHLSRGTPSEKIGFLSFTKRATEEAKGRAKVRFGLSDSKLPYFRTMHSLAFMQLGMNKKQVLSRYHYRELAKKIGVEISGYQNEDGDTYGLPKGDRLLFLCGLSRVRCESLRQTWEDVGEDLDFREVEQFQSSVYAYKRTLGLSDFTDMLESFEKLGPFPSLEVLFVDEAQDLSRLQWKIVEKLSEKSKEVVIAGDDDQAIYKWGGADVDTFIAYPGTVKILNKSYRLGKQVHKSALSIIENIGKRRPKGFAPSAHTDSVHYHNCIEDVDLSSGEWLVLVRNGYMASDIKNLCDESGYHYSYKQDTPGHSEAVRAARIWGRRRSGVSSEEATLLKKYGGVDITRDGVWFDCLTKIPNDEESFIRAASRRGEKLSGPPRIRISTIHGAKGAEAQNVLLLTDMSSKTFDSYQRDPDSEARVFYVGATRAKENLHIVLPQTKNFFEI